MILDGRTIALQIQNELEKQIFAMRRKPGLAFILVGENPASQSYVRAKKKGCAATGILSTLIELPSHTTQVELLTHIQRLNQDPAIDGILIQLPLPLHLDDRAILSAISPSKDVDGFHPINVGKILLGDETAFLPCTPSGIKELLQRSHIPVAGKRVVIVGRSNIVGKPLAALLMQKKVGCNATVTIAHSQSEHLDEIAHSADILVAAAGHPRLIRGHMVKKGAVVIDVGINRVQGTLVGDVDFEEVSSLASHITPVPGGVGPMTIAMLLSNTVKASRNQCPLAK
jgi:methylenetetrahydrofolate dehydrogenase (NADP+)/methenyltetrahydrofolate cyclohydrolase